MALVLVLVLVLGGLALAKGFSLVLGVCVQLVASTNSAWLHVTEHIMF